MHLLLTLQVLVLLTLANGVPVITKDIVGDRFATPIDRGAKFVDGRPVFGSSKTFRGIIVSIVITSAASPLVGLDWKIGVLVASVAMSGDLLSSFLKRRINIPPSGRATGLDQVPESLLPFLACRIRLPLTAVDIVVGTATFFVGELLLSRLLHYFHLRDRPY